MEKKLISARCRLTHAKLIYVFKINRLLELIIETDVDTILIFMTILNQ